jgi:hypothetical protein
MPPVKAANRKDPVVHLHDFKLNAEHLLPRGHPLLKILKNVPDDVRLSHIAGRAEDWLVLLEG